MMPNKHLDLSYASTTRFYWLINFFLLYYFVKHSLVTLLNSIFTRNLEVSTRSLTSLILSRCIRNTFVPYRSLTLLISSCCLQHSFVSTTFLPRANKASSKATRVFLMTNKATLIKKAYSSGTNSLDSDSQTKKLFNICVCVCVRERQRDRER